MKSSEMWYEPIMEEKNGKYIVSHRNERGCTISTKSFTDKKAAKKYLTESREQNFKAAIKTKKIMDTARNSEGIDRKEIAEIDISNGEIALPNGYKVRIAVDKETVAATKPMSKKKESQAKTKAEERVSYIENNRKMAIASDRK